MRHPDILKKYERKVATRQPENELDKIRLWFFQQGAHMLAHDKRIVLTQGQIEKKDMLMEVWGLLIKYSEQEVEGMVMQKYGYKNGMALYVINQCQELFANIKNINREAQRALRIAQREYEIRMIKEDEALEAKDRYDLVHKNLERIEKMLKLDKEDELSFKEVVDKLQLPQVLRSTDAAILDEDTEDQDAEDISE
jgi:hypothetical protein